MRLNSPPWYFSPAFPKLPFGERLLKDRFVWDPNEPLNNPEEFAAALCQDLGLSGDFIPTVAFTIREQIHLDRKVGFGNSGS